MEKINFENLPSTNTPLNADTLNDMQDGIEKSANYIGSTQPSTGEKVWFKTGATKEILVKNSNNVFETYYSENKPVNYTVIAATTIDSNLTAYATDTFDFSIYSEIVVQLGSGSEGDSIIFKIPNNPNNSNLINSVAHLDMYASSSYRCRAFASLYFNNTSAGVVRVNPKQLTGWSSVGVTIKGVLK